MLPMVGYLPPMPSVFLVNPGPRPTFTDLADHLWGAGCEVDSEGNAAAVKDRFWTELTLTLRPAYRERIDVDPLDGRQPIVLVIRSENEELMNRAALFLHAESGGALSDDAPDERGNDR